MRAIHSLVVRFGAPIALAAASCLPVQAENQPPMPPDVDRSPVDLALHAKADWLATANQTSHSVSLIRPSSGEVLDEMRVGARPSAIVRRGDDQLLVSCSHAGALEVLAVEGPRLTRRRTIPLDGEPLGIALSPDGNTAWVALHMLAQVAEVDLSTGRVRRQLSVGKWPSFLAVSPDESKLAVATSGDRGMSVVDLKTGELFHLDRFVGLNFGHVQASRDNRYAYYPWMVYRRTTVSASNIRRGWVLASRVGRTRFDEQTRREAFSLDPPGKAIADPFGLRLTSDERWIVVSAAGTHELLVYRNDERLPFQDHGGTDHVDPKLLADTDRFYRIDLPGRPMGLRIAPDDQTVYIANYLENTVQVVDLSLRQLAGSLAVGGPAKPSLARRGEAIFYDARRSLDQWYSCHSCHQDGGSNAVPMDTLNDGSSLSFKTVLPLYDITHTAPWTWHGWQGDLREAMHKSITQTMVGKAPSDEDVQAMLAYLGQLKTPPNPHRRAGSELSPSAVRGRKVFVSQKAGCAACHSGPWLTDGEVHEVGTGSRGDRYRGYNTPSLKGVHRKVRLLHDGRGQSLEELLREHHRPEDVTGQGPLTEQQLQDLIDYLRTL